MSQHDFSLTTRQKANLIAGKSVQLSHKQLTAPSPAQSHVMRMDMTGDGLNKLHHSLSKNKGFRLTAQHHTGGNIFKSISKGVKKATKSVGNTISKGVSVAGNVIKDTYSTVNKTALKQNWGGYVEAIKSAVPEKVLTEVIKGGLMATGMDEQSATVLAGSASGAVYSVEFDESLKGQGDEAVSGAIIGGVTSGAGFLDVAKKVASNKGVQKVALASAKEGYKSYKNSKKTPATGDGFYGSGFKGSGFQGSSFQGSGFQGSVFQGSGFQGSGFQGSGFKGSGLKGSQEMKDKMAKLRAMRKTKPDSNIKMSFGDGFKDS